MIVDLLAFVERHKARILGAVRQRLATALPSVHADDDRLAMILDAAYEAYSDVLVTGETEGGGIAADVVIGDVRANPAEMSLVVTLPLLIGDELRRLWLEAPEGAQTTGKPEAVLEAIEATAHRHACLVLDAMQDRLDPAIEPRGGASRRGARSGAG